MITLKEMRPEDRLLFVLTRQRFLDAHQQAALDICNSSKIQWDVVYSTARLHGITPLIYSNLQQCVNINLGMPQDIMNQFKLCYYRNVVMVKQKAEMLTEVLSYLEKKFIDVMLIKGTALDVLVYDHPWLTIQNDVDLMFRPRNVEINEKEKVEIFLFLESRDVEFGYLEHHDIDLRGFLPINFQRIWDESAKITFMGHGVFVMTPEDMLIATCINSCRKRFFRLKTLCDIAEIINKYKDLKWDEVASKAIEQHCNNIVYTALLITKMTLGCELSEEILNSFAVVPARAFIIQCIIRYLNQNMSLSSLYPFSVENPKERKLNLSLVLPYTTYSWNQWWFKMRNSWKHFSKIRLFLR